MGKMDFDLESCIFEQSELQVHGAANEGILDLLSAKRKAEAKVYFTTTVFL